MTPLDASLRLEEHLGCPTSGFLFPHPTNDGPMTASLTSDHVCRFFKKHGIDGTLHRCRHRFATELLRVNSGDLVMLQRLLGHASIDQSLRYAAWTGQRAAVDSVALIA